MATTPMTVDSGATSAAAAALEALQEVDDSDSDEFSALLPMAQGLAAGAAVLGAGLRTVDSMAACSRSPPLRRSTLDAAAARRTASCSARSTKRFAASSAAFAKRGIDTALRSKMGAAMCRQCRSRR